MKTKNWTIGICLAATLSFSIAEINAAEPEQEPEAAVELAKLSKIPASGFTKLLNQSTSPDKKFAIAIGAKDGQPPKWVEDANDSYRMWEEAKTCNYLVDLQSDRVTGILEMRTFDTSNRSNHQSKGAKWSPDSRWLVEEQQWKWDTGVCSVHKIKADGSIAASLDLKLMAGEVLNQVLDKQSPGLSKEIRENYALSVSVDKISNDGTLLANVSAEVPKADEPPSVNVSVAARILQKENGELSVEIKKVEPKKED